MAPPVRAITNQARCFQSCIPPGDHWAVGMYLVYLIITEQQPPAVADLANEARCFASCIPDGMHWAVFNYLLTLWLSSTPEGSDLTTEAGERIITEDGDVLIVE